MARIWHVGLGLVLGWLLGLTIGLLLAPSPGWAVREQIRKRREPAVERLKRAVRRRAQEKKGASAS